MEKDKQTPKYRYDHARQRVYIEADDTAEPVDEQMTADKTEQAADETQRPQPETVETEPLSEADKLELARREGRVADPEQFADMDDKELARHKSVLLGRLAGALDASTDRNDAMVDDLLGKILSAQVLEAARKNATAQPDASTEVEVYDGAEPNDITTLERADIEEVAALLEGELQEAGDDNFLQVATALQRFYDKAGEVQDLSEAERRFMYEKITALLQIAEAMRFISTEPAEKPTGDRPEAKVSKKDDELLLAAATQHDIDQSEDAAATTATRSRQAGSDGAENDEGRPQSIEDILRSRYRQMELPDTKAFEPLPDEGLREAREQRRDELQSILDSAPKDLAGDKGLAQTVSRLGDELIAIDHVQQMRFVQSGNRSMTIDNIPARLHKMDLNQLMQAFPADLQNLNRLNNVYYGLLRRSKAVAGYASSQQLVRQSLEKVDLLRDMVNRRLLMEQSGWDAASHDKLQRMKLFVKPRQNR